MRCISMIAIAAALAAATCGKQPQVGPTQDAEPPEGGGTPGLEDSGRPEPLEAGVGSLCNRMCAVLAAFGCEEAGPKCPDACRATIGRRETKLSPGCVERAACLGDLRACPTIKCLKGK